MEWLDKKGISHPVASCHCWRCHVFILTGLASGGRLGESGSRFDPGSSKFSTKLELPQPARVAETATALALRRRWLILGVVLVGSFMAILDVFIVTQGLPSIKTSLGAGVADLELVVSAYSLVYAVFLITGGRLGDILDRKRIFLFGMTVFTVASALAGYASSAVFLIGARALQGLGAALVYPQVLSIIQVTFKGSERALALGLFAAINGIGALTGNILGGLLIQTQRGRSLLETYLPRPHTRRHHRDPGRIPSSSPFQNGTSTQAGPARCWTDIPLSRLTDPSARR